MEKIYYIPTDKKILCLTFDDSPNNPTTSIILDVLKKYNIKATFFVLIINAIRNPNILKRIITDGHAVGLHGLTHRSFRKHTKGDIYHHVKKCIRILRESFGVETTYFRPPYGTLTKDTEMVAKEFNITPVGWTVMENDWKPGGVGMKSSNIIKKSSPGKIIVMHDGYRDLVHKGATIEIFKKIVPQLIDKEYSFVSIPELVASKSNRQYKIFTNVPLLCHEVIDFAERTTLFLYWDVNFIHPNTETFQLKIIENNKIIIDTSIKFPSPNAMEEWVQQIQFPLNSINKNSEILIA